VKALEKVYNDLLKLDERRKNLNIVNKSVLPKDKLDSVLEQAATQVKFSMEFNQMKLANAPVCKLTIEQSKESLEKA